MCSLYSITDYAPDITRRKLKFGSLIFALKCLEKFTLSRMLRCFLRLLNDYLAFMHGETHS